MKAQGKTLIAFTLVELLLVMALIAVLMSLVGSGLWKIRQKGLSDRTRVDMRAMEQAIRSYRAEYEQWPGTGLVTNKSWAADNSELVKYLVPSNPIPPYSSDINSRHRVFWEIQGAGNNLQFCDGWGTPIKVTIDADNEIVRFMSAGPDKNINTIGDNLIHEGH